MKSNDYSFAIGKIHVPKVKYQYFKKARKKLNDNELKMKIDDINLVENDLYCNIVFSMCIHAARFSIELETTSKSKVSGKGINERIVNEDKEIQAELLRPLLYKAIEVAARLTGDSGAYPLIFKIEPEEILEGSTEN